MKTRKWKRHSQNTCGDENGTVMDSPAKLGSVLARPMGQNYPNVLLLQCCFAQPLSYPSFAGHSGIPRKVGSIISRCAVDLLP